MYRTYLLLLLLLIMYHIQVVEAVAAVGVWRNVSGFFHDRIVGVLHRGVAMSRRCAGGGSRGPTRGRKPFLARAVIKSPIIFFLHNQSSPSSSSTLVVNVNTLSVSSVGLFLAVGRRDRIPLRSCVFSTTAAVVLLEA